MTTLPELDPQQYQQSQKLSERIQRCMAQQGGHIGFDQFMQQALYDPDYGYYVRQQTPFGRQGDFITAPELSPLFAYVLARQCMQIFQTGLVNNIMEIGAGSGVLAKNILAYLAKHAALPERYIIVEKSSSLRNVQRQFLQEQLPQTIDRVQWLALEQVSEFSGVVLANELFDALPFKRIVVNDNTVRELRVGYEQGFVWKPVDIEPADKDFYHRYIAAHVGQPDHYQSELHGYRDVLQAILGSLHEAVLLITDYGSAAKDYYSSGQQDGSLRCFYRHRIHADPFMHIGCQDITCSVQFSALAHIAIDCGFSLSGYTTQANFLLANGLDAVYCECETDASIDRLKLAQQIKTLTLPDEMGERFKAMALGKDFDAALDGFSLNDHSYSL